MDNGNLVKPALNLTLSDKLRDSSGQSLIQASRIAFRAFHSLKMVDYDSAGFDFSNTASYNLNLHLKPPFT